VRFLFAFVLAVSLAGIVVYSVIGLAHH